MSRSTGISIEFKSISSSSNPIIPFYNRFLSSYFYLFFYLFFFFLLFFLFLEGDSVGSLIFSSKISFLNYGFYSWSYWIWLCIILSKFKSLSSAIYCLIYNASYIYYYYSGVRNKSGQIAFSGSASESWSSHYSS